MLSASDEAAFAQWRERFDDGHPLGLIDLYELVASARACSVFFLPDEVRHELAQRAFTVLWPNFEQVAPPRYDAEVTLEAHNPVWLTHAAAHCDRLSAALPEARIEHIGSTAVAGLSAKPIIDLMVSVADLTNEASYRSACETEGVVLTTRDDHHRYFAAAAPHPRNLHIHVCAIGSDFEREHLLFRDYLRAHPNEIVRYAEAKAEALATWGHDRFGYTYAKSEAISAIAARAEAWAKVTGWSVDSH